MKAEALSFGNNEIAVKHNEERVDVYSIYLGLGVKRFCLNLFLFFDRGKKYLQVQNKTLITNNTENKN